MRKLILLAATGLIFIPLGCAPVEKETTIIKETPVQKETTIIEDKPDVIINNPPPK